MDATGTLPPGANSERWRALDKALNETGGAEEATWREGKIVWGGKLSFKKKSGQTYFISWR